MLHFQVFSTFFFLFLRDSVVSCEYLSICSSKMDGQNMDPEMQRFLQQQAGQARVTAVAMGFTDICWEKCVDKVGGKVIGPNDDSRTASCLQNCVERFLDTTDFILKRLESKSA